MSHTTNTSGLSTGSRSVTTARTALANEFDSSLDKNNIREHGDADADDADNADDDDDNGDGSVGRKKTGADSDDGANDDNDDAAGDGEDDIQSALNYFAGNNNNNLKKFTSYIF